MRIRAALVIWLLCGALAILAPLLWSSAVWLGILSKAAILVLFALSYNVMFGQAGLLSFGHGFYFGLSAYACLHLTNAIGTQGLLFPIELVPLAGGVVGGLLGVSVGRVITKQAGTAFAMITLGIGELAHAAAYVFPSFFGGEQGISTDRMVGWSLTGFSFGPAIQVYYLNLFWVLIIALFLWLLTRTPLGRAAVAVRENSERITFLGYDARTVRWLQVTISGAAAGVAGGLFALTYEIATAEVLGLRVSANVLVATYLGGATYFIGPVLGALLVTMFEEVIGKITEAWLLYYGVLFVVVVMFAPRGMAGLVTDIFSAFKHREGKALIIKFLRNLPALCILILGSVIIVETSFRLSNSFVGGGEMVLFGISYDAQSPGPWVIGSSLSLVGLIWLLLLQRSSKRRV